MAKLIVKKMSFSDAMAQESPRFRIGHNRWIECFSINGFLQGKLYGHAIFELTDKGELTLDPCGYRTVTTRQAMKDFGRLFGIAVSVSFAKGGFSARVNGADHQAGISGMISAQVVL
jgi:hypothetical protein